MKRGIVMENVEYKRVDKKAESVMRLTAIFLNLLVFIVVLAVVLILWLAAEVMSNGLAVGILAVVFVLLVIYVVVAPAIRYKRYRYYVDDDMLIVVEGLFFITKSIAPIERIHQIAINRGPIDRIFGMSNVDITTAGGQVRIAFLEDSVAEEIAEKLKTRINTIVKAEKEMVSEGE